MGKETRIIILDDEVIVGERLKASLERVGYIVDTCSTSDDALNRIKEEAYDILITDLKMSGLDGLQVLQKAKQIRPDIKSIVITGFATKDTAEEVIRRGAVKFIAKPFKISHLKDVVRELSGLKESVNE